MAEHFFGATGPENGPDRQPHPASGPHTASRVPTATRSRPHPSRARADGYRSPQLAAAGQKRSACQFARSDWTGGHPNLPPTHERPHTSPPPTLAGATHEQIWVFWDRAQHGPTINIADGAHGGCNCHALPRDLRRMHSPPDPHPPSATHQRTGARPDATGATVKPRAAPLSSTTAHWVAPWGHQRSRHVPRRSIPPPPVPIGTSDHAAPA